MRCARRSAAATVDARADRESSGPAPPRLKSGGRQSSSWHLAPRAIGANRPPWRAACFACRWCRRPGTSSSSASSSVSPRRIRCCGGGGCTRRRSRPSRTGARRRSRRLTLGAWRTRAVCPGMENTASRGAEWETYASTPSERGCTTSSRVRPPPPRSRPSVAPRATRFLPPHSRHFLQSILDPSPPFPHPVPPRSRGGTPGDGGFGRRDGEETFRRGSGL